MPKKKAPALQAELEEAIEFVREARKSTPPDNELVKDMLDTHDKKWTDQHYELTKKIKDSGKMDK